jgi:hypothetical protein
MKYCCSKNGARGYHGCINPDNQPEEAVLPQDCYKALHKVRRSDVILERNDITYRFTL